MVARASGLESVFVRVTAAPTAPAVRTRGLRATSDGDDLLRPTPYRAWVYSKLALPIERAVDPPSDLPMEWAGDPLAGVETFVVNWATYTDYASSYFEGEKGAGMMRERLFEALPPGLSAILAGDVGGGHPTRTWFHSDAPEVSQLPWELVAYADRIRLSTGGSFVRGIPPETATPVIPVSGRLRLGVIDPEGRTAPPLGAALAAIDGPIEVLRLSGGIRRGLHAAAEEGVELVHIVAAASVTPSHDGVLVTADADDKPIASAELASILRGCRVRLVGLSPPAGDPSARWEGPYQMPSVYRAFTYFASSPYPIPTFALPVGPMDDSQVHGFWTTFYQALASKLEIEAALIEAQRSRIVPIGLFLRQLQPSSFRMVSELERPTVEPSVVNAQLETSQDLLRQLELLSSNLGFKSATVKKLEKQERERHSKLQQDVSEWIEGVHEE